jgi:hypothetical protein
VNQVGLDQPDVRSPGADRWNRLLDAAVARGEVRFGSTTKFDQERLR